MRGRMGDEEQCRPDSFKNAGFPTICAYVKANREVCEGGGYFLWTEMQLCSTSPPLRLLIGLLAIVFFLLLFLHLSTTADSFFCKNIASIVDLHKISQNIAGITFMAFGNGAPDIFSSIASVISVSKPRAELAVSELLGGGIFVTSCVVAAIALNRPFLLMRRPILRDLCFYLTALALLAFIALRKGQLSFWQPLCFLLLYLLYALTVVIGNSLHKRQLCANKGRPHGRLQRAIARILPKKAKVGPSEKEEEKRENFTAAMEEAEYCGGKRQQQRSNGTGSTDTNGSTLVIHIAPKEGEQLEQEFHALDYLEAGKFFCKEELDANESGEEEEQQQQQMDSTAGGTPPAAPSSILSLATSCSGSPLPDKPGIEEEGIWPIWKAELGHSFFQIFHSLKLQHFRRLRWPALLLAIVKLPSMLLLCLTVPRACQLWSKPIAILHALLAPLTFCTAFKLLDYPLIAGGVVFAWHLSLILGLFLATLLALFTSIQKEPVFFKWISSYMGFVLAVAWIYATATEVLNVVLMFGNLFHISYQILGLTAIAWCNSIGDFIADTSVARQGMPRMAFSAAIGAPLFNLMVGFGSTFLIANLQKKVITISADPVSKVMFLFLGLSLLSTMVLLILQKFYVRRWHGIILLCVYALFILSAIFASQGIWPF